MDRELPFRISGFSAGPLVGRVVFILDFKLTLLLLCCNALQVLCWDEDTLGAPEQFCRYFFSGAVETVLFWWCVYYPASLSTSTTARCWLCLIVSGRVPFLTRHIHPEMNEFVWPATDGHSPNPGWPRSLCHWAAPRHLVNNVKLLLLVLTPFGTCSFSGFGHVNKYSWVDSERLG